MFFLPMMSRCRRRWAVLLLGASLLGPAAGGCAGGKAGGPVLDDVRAPAIEGHGEFPDVVVNVGRGTRHLRLVVPRSVDVGRPAPLVVAFHGMAIDSKDVMPKYTKLSETASRHGFIIAYPQAIAGSWGLAPQKIVADIAFFDALLAHVGTTHRIDPDRIYVLGMSNGGYFAHLLAKERSTVIAAVASHSGPLGLQTLAGVNAARKFPVLIAHGTRDGIFPVAFAKENVEKYRREGHEVRYVEVPGLRHAWASGVDINEQIWAFFAEHPRSARR